MTEEGRKHREGAGEDLRRNGRAQPITGTWRKEEWIRNAEEVCGIWKVREGCLHQSQGHLQALQSRLLTTHFLLIVSVIASNLSMSC